MGPVSNSLGRLQGTCKRYTLSTFLHNISSIQTYVSWTILQRLIAPCGDQQLHQSLR